MKPNKNTALFWIVLTLILGTVLAACSSEKAVTGQEREDVLAFAEPKTENLLQSLTNADLSTFTKDMIPEMTQAYTPAQFENLTTLLDTNIGQYVSREVTGVSKTGKFYVVIYKAKFSLEDGDVVMRVVFEQSDPHLISGLWFSSPKLIEASKKQ